MTPSEVESREMILVVEDDQVNLKLMQSVIEEGGYRVCAVADGRQCLEQACEIRPDLILMDIVMPELDGIQTCSQLRSLDGFKDIPIIFVTSKTEDGMLQQAFDCGGSDYVRKPVNRVELLARIRTALNQRRAALEQAEKQRLKGALETAGGVCHDLNQPLQYVMGALQLVMMDLDPASPVYRKMEAIRARVDQMGLITRKLAEVTCYRTKSYAGGQSVIDLDKSSQS